MKRFDQRNDIKKGIHNQKRKVYIYTREVWIAHL